jgi:arabinose-5-phosphate isomerase
MAETPCPVIEAGVSMGDALIEMSAKGFGCVGVRDKDGTLVGMITDGDLRRNMSGNLTTQRVDHVMTHYPVTVEPDTLASEALRRMTAGERKITQLFVCDADGKPLGLLHIHDLLRAGVS